MMSGRDTIFALSSGAGRAGIAIIRLSGPEAKATLETLTRDRAPEPRKAAYKCFYRPSDGDKLDHGLVLFFPAPHSFTGEDVAEFHIHGGPAVITSVSESLSAAGLRPAEPGEFTRRAFENGKLDLTEAEGLADLIAAQTEAQRRQALRQMEGSLGALYESWRADVVQALAYLEAIIDFPDEEIPDETRAKTAPLLTRVRHSIARHLDDKHRGERLRDGVRMVILGPPNVGKSSLLNALARRDVAIVSNISGTTRDVIEVQLDLAGIPVSVADTAGLKENSDAIESEGIRRAHMRAADADVRLWVDHVTDHGAPPAHQQIDPRDVVIVNKIDLWSAEQRQSLASDKNRLYLSVKTGEGLSELIQVLSDRVTAAYDAAEAPNLSRLRHRQALEKCHDSLGRCLETASDDISLWAEDARMASRQLGRITGRTDVEDILDVIFADFCIGK